MHILQCNVMERLQQHPHLTTNCTDRTFLLWRLNLASWASEGFLPGEARRGFSLKFFQGGPKVLKFVIYPLKLKKQPFFANNFKFQGGPCPSSDAHAWHGFRILVIAPFCCNQKARAARAPSFTLAASNNRDDLTRSLNYCLFTPHINNIWVSFYAHIPFVVNNTFNALPTDRLHHCTDVITKNLESGDAGLPDWPFLKCVGHEKHIWPFYEISAISSVCHCKMKFSWTSSTFCTLFVEGLIVHVAVTPQLFDLVLPWSV